MSATAIALPGLFDLQVNGFAGVDFNDRGLTPERAGDALARIRATGVTRCLPTLITSAFEHFAACARVLSRVRSPSIAGIHMEGPYISPVDGARGAHPVEHVLPASVEDFKRRQEASDGRIALVTLAPEVEGATALIEHLVSTGVRVAIGHTMATGAQIHDAVAAGATLATHVGNGCAALLPRHPNHIWEILANDALAASLIVDGHHLPGSTVKAMIRAKGPRRTVLITDAIAAAGCAPGRHTIAGVACDMDADGRVSLPGTSYLAGSSLTLPRAIANVVKFTGLPLDAVVPMATTIPAELIGMHPAGSISAVWDGNAHDLRIESVRD